MEDPDFGSAAILLKPYFGAMVPASGGLIELFNEAIKLTGVYGNGKIHLEHVFYAMTERGSGSGKELLMSAGVDLYGFKSNLTAYLQALAKEPPASLTLSQNVHDALSGTAEEARITNHHEAESVHFLLSALKVTPENPIWNLHDITYTKLLSIYTQSSDMF